MKNLLVLCILFFAFQNAIFAQNDFGIIIGGGLHNQDFILDSKSKFTPQFKAGFSYQRNIVDNRLRLSSSLNFHYFIGNEIEYSEAITEVSIIGGGGFIEDNVLSSYNYSNAKNKSYFAVTLPIILSINYKKFSFGGGIEFQYRTVNPDKNLAYVGNVQYQLSERFSIDANFVRSLTDDSYFSSSRTKTRTQRIEATLRYRLLKK
jgi:hypothetical protein